MTLILNRLDVVGIRQYQLHAGSIGYRVEVKTSALVAREGLVVSETIEFQAAEAIAVWEYFCGQAEVLTIGQVKAQENACFGVDRSC